MMQSFVRGGREVRFSSITGKIAGSSKRSETDVIGGQGYSRTKQEFFIRVDDGREIPFQLTRSNIPIRDGQSVSMISGTLDGTTYLPVRLVNYVTGETWEVYGDRACVAGFRLARKRDVSKGIALAVVIVGAAVGFVFFSPGNSPAFLSSATPCLTVFGLPLLAGLVFLGRDFAHFRRVAGQFNQHCNALAREVLEAGGRQAVSDTGFSRT